MNNEIIVSVNGKTKRFDNPHTASVWIFSVLDYDLPGFQAQMVYFDREAEAQLNTEQERDEG